MRLSVTIHRTIVFVIFVLSLASAPLQPATSGSPAETKSSAAILANAHCQPLPPPTGTIVHVATVADLVKEVNVEEPNRTILIADGTYNLNGAYLRLDQANTTLRSASGDREAVILDGNDVTTEIIQIVASNVTLADLTLRAAYNHPIHVMPTQASDSDNTLIYNVHIIDPGQQAIKINPVGAGTYPDDGQIACSHIELTDVGRPKIRDNCYTGGIDAHQAEGWIVRDNLIEGFWCPSGLSEHAIHFWRGCRDTLVERNVLVDNARGVGFGLASSGTARTYPDNPCPTANGGYVDHYGGIIRNNFVFADRAALFSSQYGFDCGICLWQACGAQALHNTVATTDSPFSSIEWRFSHTLVEIKNNLVSHNLRDRGGTSDLSGNLENTPLSVFVDGPGGDLHLDASAAIAIDQVPPLAEVYDDIDADVRPIGSASDIGADEYGIQAPPAVNNLRVAAVITKTGTLTPTLVWTPPANAITTTLRYTNVPIFENNWFSASLLTNTLTGSAKIYTATVPYTSGTLYFALKTHGGESGWSEVSNNAFWPRWNVYLPVSLHRVP